MTIAAGMREGKLACLQFCIQVIIYQPRRIVALQGHHHRKVTSQVVAAQVIVKRLVALVAAAHYAACQLHLRGVIEADTGFVLYDVL